MKKQQTVESQVATAILERAVGEVTIDGKTYSIGSPSVATLILVSEIVSTLPVVENVPQDKVVYSVLRYAKDFKPLGEICAILILGARGLSKQVEETVVERKWWLFKRKKKVVRTVDLKGELSRLILETMQPQDIFNVIVGRLNLMQVGSFFAITTSLGEANVLKPTKEVEN